MSPRAAFWMGGVFLSCMLLFRSILFMETNDILQLEIATYMFTGENCHHSQHILSQGPSVTSAETTGKGNDKAKNEESTVLPRICSEETLQDPIWEWHYGSLNETISRKKQLLIATYSAFGKYARLLELTSPINKAYAKHWKYDMVILQGTSLILPEDENCTPTEERSMFNKIALLLEALNQKNKYNYLLLMDADALIYDFSFDIVDLITTNETMLVAQATNPDSPPATRKINNGITLWNLHHHLTRQVAEDWNHVCRQGIPLHGDQFFLQRVLKSDDRIAAVSAVQKEFRYRSATVVKHFLRLNSRSWNDTSLDAREEEIINATTEICTHFGLDENRLERKDYTMTRAIRRVR